MARKSARTGLENEIERTRWEEKWENIPKLLEQLTNRTTSGQNVGVLKEFLTGEAQLETFLRDHCLGSTDPTTVTKELQETVDTLNKIATKDKGQKGEHGQEALLLLCKAHFILGDFQNVVKCCNEAQADDLAVDLMSKRKAKMVADALAYKAMALEQLQSLGQLVISDDDIIYFYESAGDIAMWIMTDQGTTVQRGAATPTGGELGQALEVAIQRAPLLLIKNGKFSKGILRFRSLLQIVETKATYSLRKALAKQLAQVLLHGMCERAYERAVYQGPNISASSLSLRSTPGPTAASINNMSSKRTSFPLKPRVNMGEGLFIPRDEMEETLLLLLLEEAMVLKDSVLSHAPEHEEARRRCVADANAVYDLLTVALVRRVQYGMLTECLDRGMKLAFEEFHLWFQFALALISAGKHARALLVLKQCRQLKPQDTMVPLYAAKLCFNNLHLISDGIEFAQKVVSLGDENDMSSKGYLALGLGYSLQASEANLRSDRQRIQKKAIEALKRAHELDKDDAEILFHLSLNQAIMRQISKALRNIRSCLKLDGNNVSFLHLMVLILSAQKKFSEALEVCDAALLEFPEDIGLLLTKVKLEEVCVGGEQALVTCKRLLETWKLVYDSDLSGSMEFMIRRAGSGLLDRVVADNRSLKQMPLTDIESEKDSGDASSIAASVRLEQALSEEALSANTGRLSVPAALALQAKLWLAVAEVYIGMGKDVEASACVLEATLIFPLSPDVLFQRGQTCEGRGDLGEAKNCYDNAIAINPSHIQSLQRLGVVYQERGNLTMAEKVLREAINIEPTSHVTWHNLGVVLEALGEHEAASDCLLTAVDLEATSPITPFTVIPRFL